MSRSISKIDQTLERFRMKLRLNGPASGNMERLRDAVSRVDSLFVNSRFKGTLLALTRELVTNGFKAVQKRHFLDHIKTRDQAANAKDSGHGGFPDWREEFRAAIDDGVIQDYMPEDPEAIYVDVALQLNRRHFILEVRNPGAATPEELQRIRQILSYPGRTWAAPDSTRSGDVGDLDLEADAPIEGEGAGLGLRMVLMTLDGMGIARRNLELFVEGDETAARLRFPLGILYRGGIQEKPRLPCEILDGPAAAEIVAGVEAQMKLDVLVFESDGRLLSVTPEFLRRHAPPGRGGQADPTALTEFLPGKFYEDFFLGPQSVREGRPITNYRVPVPVATTNPAKTATDIETAAGKRAESSENAAQAKGPLESMLYHVNAAPGPGGTVHTVWQQILSGSGSQTLGHGFLEDSTRASRLISPYIPATVVDRAREVVRSGGEALPDEIVERAIFFSDLVGFTRMTEDLPPGEALSLLNIAMDICVRTILKNNGVIDKFLGDGILAIYRRPIEGVISAFEIQYQFEQLNQFRELQGLAPLAIRTGIHSGQVVFGSVGNRDRKDWTVIGDVVNTAARIQSFATAGEVVVSKTTLESMRNQVQISKQNSVLLKGKPAPLELVTIDRVYYRKGRLPVEMSRTGFRVLLPGEARTRLDA
ncbi:MAG: adenylate/guanylate cyclase domain-containing protein [Leptospirales bacterium]